MLIIEIAAGIVLGVFLISHLAAVGRAIDAAIVLAIAVVAIVAVVAFAAINWPNNFYVCLTVAPIFLGIGWIIWRSLTRP
jgi:hypothetical protein